MEGDEIGVDIEGLAIDDELEGGRSVDTARRVRNTVGAKDGDGVPFALACHRGCQECIERRRSGWMKTQSICLVTRERWATNKLGQRLQGWWL